MPKFEDVFDTLSNVPEMVAGLTEGPGGYKTDSKVVEAALAIAVVVGAIGWAGSKVLTAWKGSKEETPPVS